MISCGNYKLSSGIYSDFKIFCDDFSDENWDSLAKIANTMIEFEFCEVYGIPSGGVRLANNIKKYCVDPEISDLVLIVDDVCTTGKSFLEAKELFPKRWHYCLCVFDRGNHAYNWVNSIFKLNSDLRYV